ncbi:MAG TPA: DUF3047 domain-containing protein [Methylomirabilota bacterium]|nr:DUF3047 domain-containing protein [Methylomirabilota bacterium]
MTRRLAVIVLAAALLAGAAARPNAVRIDDWSTRRPGPLDLSDWRVYPFGRTPTFKQPPAIVLDDGRRVLELRTTDEAMRIGRGFGVDPHKTPMLVWEWKALALPAGGDVRDLKRNDQAARLMLMFEGMKGLLYVWDTMSPVGTESRPEDFDIFERALIVVRSGPAEAGRWWRERRDVNADFRRQFGEAPRTIKWVGLESHSNDTHSTSGARFGAVGFEPR